MMHRRQKQLMDVAGAARYDSSAQKYLEDEVLKLIKTLKI